MRRACKICGCLIEGYKCDDCGAEFDEVPDDHSCGIDHCYPKCSGCGQAEMECSCNDDKE